MTARTSSPKKSSRRVPVRASSVAVDVSSEGVRVPLAASRVKAIVQGVCARERVRGAMISVTFVTSRAIAKMHREYLQHAGPTDIITFELREHDGAIVGDIYIAPDVARAHAVDHGVGIREELVRLVVHGTLHVLGYTHPEDESRTASTMWRKQERYVAALG